MPKEPRRAVRPFVVTLRYDIGEHYLDLPDEGIGFVHPTGVKVLVGYRADGAPCALTETDHDDDALLESIEADQPNADNRDPRLTAFMDEIRTSHRQAATDIVSNLRWMLARPGGHQSVGRRQSARYLVKGQDEWRPLLMGRLAPRAGVVGKVEIDEPWRSAIQEATRQGWEEPVAHAILREARDQIDANARSALVLSWTALEVGLDQQENRVAWPNLTKPPTQPTAGDNLWVIKGDVGRLLRQARDLERSRWLDLPDWAAERLEAGRIGRNRVVHDGQPSLPRQGLVELARTVGDVLYLLDYQANHDWAQVYVGYVQGDGEQVFGTPVFIGEMAED